MAPILRVAPLLTVGCAAFQLKAPMTRWNAALPRSPAFFVRFSSVMAEEPAVASSGTGPSPPQQAEQPRPGTEENLRFRTDYTVQRWRDFQAGGEESAVDNFRAAAAIPAKYATTSPAAAKYWAGHVARTSYFLANAVAGTTAFSLFKQQQQQQQQEEDGEEGGSSMGSAMGFGNSGGESSGGSRPLDGAGGISAEVASRLLLEAMMTYEQDWQSVSRGDFAFPWDMEPLTNHRQQQPLYALRQSIRFVQEAVGTLDRRSQGEAAKGVWLDSGDSMGYPKYYQNNFHFQGDGWMSTKSANVYETSTETLFLGRQDAMQRQALLPLSEHAKQGSGARPIRRILEVACGTGRFGTFIRDNYPNADMTSVDLSPFYLDNARENHDYWQRMRGGGEGGVAAFVQAPAEALPFEDGSFDAVVCVYLFHEMPSEARALAAREMSRVLAPGGVLAFTDSVQVSEPVKAGSEQLGKDGRDGFHPPNRASERASERAANR